MAKMYVQTQKDHVYRVPEKEEQIRLVELGTHCRGAVFVDGAWVKTPALEARIEAISQTFDGFYFGRYDLRVPSIADLQAGENFKIVELNGVTSEATHIYDPKYSVFEAYRVLRHQWRLAFEIGAQNVRRGAQPTPIRVLLRRLWARITRP